MTGQKQDELMTSAYNHADELMASGISNDKIKSDLMERGLTSEMADSVVSSLVGAVKEAKQDQAKKNILYGALWCIGGIAITVGTYMAASDGGTYFVTYGAIVIGGFQILQGAYQYATA